MTDTHSAYIDILIDYLYGCRLYGRYLLVLPSAPSSKTSSLKETALTSTSSFRILPWSGLKLDSVLGWSSWKTAEELEEDEEDSLRVASSAASLAFSISSKVAESRRTY